ncbi:MAG: potassium/proton antiporter [Anaerolineae bacterium]|nr:potassium/proton antiporter [Anaerolineae bacterium]
MVIEWVLLGVAGFLLASVLASKVSDRFGVPSLLLFLALGVAAGSEGLGGIEFNDPGLTQWVGIVALNLILFAGGLDTNWRDIRPVLMPGIALSSLGVFLTALGVGAAASYLLGFSLLEGLLLGAIVSSTDAAAVFTILRSKSLGLKGKLRPLLELESGSNDPMAVFLTIGLTMWLTRPGFTPESLAVSLVVQVVLGAVLGLAFGWLLAWLANHLHLGFDGLYPVLTISAVFVAYGLTSLLGGNGFLAVYIAGIAARHHDFIHRRSLIRFHDGLAWLMQIGMFITLGLLVFPSEIVPVIGAGFLIAAVLMFIARPLGVFASLIFTKFNLREKTFISWVGLRGAVPIILATYPLIAGVEQADLIFNIVFFVVLTSALIQGASIPLVARWLGVDQLMTKKPIYPIEVNPVHGFTDELKEIHIPDSSTCSGKTIVELTLPENLLVILIARDKEFLVPNGGTTLLAGDTLIVLSDKESFDKVKDQMNICHNP